MYRSMRAFLCTVVHICAQLSVLVSYRVVKCWNCLVCVFELQVLVLSPFPVFLLCLSLCLKANGRAMYSIISKLLTSATLFPSLILAGRLENTRWLL